MTTGTPRASSRTLPARSPWTSWSGSGRRRPAGGGRQPGRDLLEQVVSCVVRVDRSLQLMRSREGEPLSGSPLVPAGLQGWSHREGVGEVRVQQPPRRNQHRQVPAVGAVRLVTARTPPVDDPGAVTCRHRHRDAQRTARPGVQVDGEPGQGRVEPSCRRSVTTRREHQVTGHDRPSPTTRDRSHVGWDREEVEHPPGGSGGLAHRLTSRRT